MSSSDQGDDAADFQRGQLYVSELLNRCYAMGKEALVTIITHLLVCATMANQPAHLFMCPPRGSPFHDELVNLGVDIMAVDVYPHYSHLQSCFSEEEYAWLYLQ